MYRIPVIAIIKSSLRNTWANFFRFAPEMMVLIVLFAIMIGLLLYSAGEDFFLIFRDQSIFESNALSPAQINQLSAEFIILGVLTYFVVLASFIWVFLRWNRYYLISDEFRGWVTFGQDMDDLLSGKGTFWRAVRKNILVLLLSICIMIPVMVVPLLNMPLLSGVVAIAMWLFLMNFVLRIYVMMPAISVQSEYGNIFKAYMLSKGNALRILGAVIISVLILFPAQILLMIVGIVLSAVAPAVGNIVMGVLSLLLYFFSLFLIGSITSEIFGHLLRARMQEEGIEPEDI